MYKNLNLASLLSVLGSYERDLILGRQKEEIKMSKEIGLYSSRQV